MGAKGGGSFGTEKGESREKEIRRSRKGDVINDQRLQEFASLCKQFTIRGDLQESRGSLLITGFVLFISSSFSFRTYLCTLMLACGGRWQTDSPSSGSFVCSGDRFLFIYFPTADYSPRLCSFFLCHCS